jgi:hypothetical protein
MKRLAALALLVAGVAVPAWGQRGGARGGGSGRGMASARGMGSGGGFSAGGRFSYAGTRTSYLPTARGSGYSSGLRAGSTVRRPVYGAPGRYRLPYAPSAYGYAGPYGWIGADYFGYPDLPADSDAGPAYGAAAQPYADGNDPQAGYASGPVEQSGAADSFRPAYRASRPAPEPKSEDAVTLVFKDGRPPEQIHNYILTRTTLHIWDQRPRDVPVDQLDLVATVKLNHDLGVAFQAPG